MTDHVDGVLITDGRNRVFLHPPEVVPGGFGFDQRIDIVGGAFRGKIRSSSYEPPKTVRSFHEQLLVLYRSLNGEATFGTTHDRIKVALRGDGRGHVSVSVEATDDTWNAQLSFSFSLDQTYLPAIIDAVERVFLSDSQA